MLLWNLGGAAFEAAEILAFLAVQVVGGGLPWNFVDPFAAWDWAFYGLQLWLQPQKVFAIAIITLADGALLNV
jgi:hypothetical protein